MGSGNSDGGKKEGERLRGWEGERKSEFGMRKLMEEGSRNAEVGNLKLISWEDGKLRG